MSEQNPSSVELPESITSIYCDRSSPYPNMWKVISDDKELLATIGTEIFKFFTPELDHSKKSDDEKIAVLLNERQLKTSAHVFTILPSSLILGESKYGNEIPEGSVRMCLNIVLETTFRNDEEFTINLKKIMEEFIATGQINKKLI